MAIKLSAVIITFNEAEHIDKCLSSLEFVADEILVIDSFSTDLTKEICEQYNVRFVEQKFLGYKEQKNFAMSKARFNYILSLDGDEALSKQLKNSILEIKNNWTLDGYYCNRLNNYCGQWIKYSDWYPDRKLRLFKKNAGEWKGINPHDSFKLYHGRKSGRLKGDLLHWIYRDYKEHREKVERFSSIAAQSYYDLGIKSSFMKIIWRPSWAFLKAYLFRRGFLDGKNGWLISKETFNVTYLKYIKLRKIWKTEK
ncbi:MAG: glycosyltransferase family 2 protein [Bacteroidetes bacterium]|nr:glycosyltransferase family 2 protein [Bacteroidota bacterium]MDA1175966.1 glycosyltransferase family 2 protein [Bacteroidota bacterium]